VLFTQSTQREKKRKIRKASLVISSLEFFLRKKLSPQHDEIATITDVLDLKFIQKKAISINRNSLIKYFLVI
jgi:hypothetical protein